jgi:hypothetical protein
MMEKAEMTLGQILRAIASLSDLELLQLKAAARKEAEKRNLKLSRHAITAGTKRTRYLCLRADFVAEP